VTPTVPHCRATDRVSEAGGAGVARRAVVGGTPPVPHTRPDPTNFPAMIAPIRAGKTNFAARKSPNVAATSKIIAGKHLFVVAQTLFAATKSFFVARKTIFVVGYAARVAPSVECAARATKIGLAILVRRAKSTEITRMTQVHGIEPARSRWHVGPSRSGIG
jgi:hypothetical protein